VHDAAQLGDESAVGAADLADRRDVEQQPLGGVGPIDEPGLDRGVVKEAGGEIVLGDAGRDERARDLAAADREAELGSRFRRLETGAGGESRAGEGKVAVVIGEAERRAVAAQELPAMAKRRRAALEMRCEGGRDGAHGGTPPLPKGEVETTAKPASG